MTQPTPSSSGCSAISDRFSDVVVLDFEFGAAPGGQQVPRCLVARGLRSGQRVELWADDLPAKPPFDVEHALFVGHYVSAEMRCFLQLGWPMPTYMVDTYIEQRRLTNGKFPASKPKAGLLSALEYHGIDS